MIVNLRGTSGSGKSYVGFKLLEEYGPGEEVYSTEFFPNRKTGAPRKKPKLIGHVLPGGLCLAGRYRLKKSTRTGGEGYSGGVDGFFPIDELQRMLEWLLARDDVHHMLFESLMISGTFQRWLDFSLRYGGPEQFAFATMDTPLELVFERIQQRNGGRPIKEETVVKHRRQVFRCAEKFGAAGARSYFIDHRYSYEQVKGLLLSGGWDPEA